MKTSKKGIDLIKSFEGCRLTAYRCPAGVWTIGYGHTAGVVPGQVITQSKAIDFLASDLIKYETAVTKNVKLPLNQAQFDALVSFTYNCGAGNLAKLIKNRNYAQIADALLLYNKGGGKVLAGLTRRRKTERELFLSGGAAVETIPSGSTYYPKCGQNHVGIAVALQSINVDSSYAFRARIAGKNGIVGYKGTAVQNTKMLSMLKQGKLIKV